MDLREWLVLIAAVPALLAGIGHTALAVSDAIRPSQFDPVDQSVRDAMRGTGMKFTTKLGAPHRTAWEVWLGMHTSHGLGLAFVSLMCLSAAVTRKLDAIPLLLPAATFYAALMVLVSVRSFFWGPVLLTAACTTLFGLAWAMA
jgi:hypothetical protein